MNVHVIICRSPGHIEAEMRDTARMLEALGVEYKVSHSHRRIATTAGCVWFIREDYEPQCLLGLRITSFENRAREHAKQQLLDMLCMMVSRVRGTE